MMIQSLQGKHIKEIACGSNHSAAITSNGELYTWGQGAHGRLGHGDMADQPKPKLVSRRQASGSAFPAASCELEDMYIHVTSYVHIVSLQCMCYQQCIAPHC